MAELEERYYWERRLARAMRGVDAQQLAALMALLGDRPERIPPEWWAAYAAALRGELAPGLEGVYLALAGQLEDSSPIGFDWGAVNERAAAWAQGYTYDLVQGITDRKAKAVGQYVSDFYTRQWTVEDLREHLAPLFGAKRAEAIATTEVTRAADQGLQGVVDEIREENPRLKMQELWETSADELVCPICAPRQGRPRGDGWDDPPPAHVNCRCGRRVMMAEPGSRRGLKL